MLRPMRPNPLIATLIAIMSPCHCQALRAEINGVEATPPEKVLCAGSGQDLLDGLEDMFGCEPVGLEQILGRRRRAEMIDADDFALQAHVMPPPCGGAGLDRDTPGHRLG